MKIMAICFTQANLLMKIISSMKITISFFQFIELLKRRFLVLHNDKYPWDLRSIEHKIVLAQHIIIYTFMIFLRMMTILSKKISKRIILSF